MGKKECASYEEQLAQSRREVEKTHLCAAAAVREILLLTIVFTWI
jgi:hypothetical protein